METVSRYLLSYLLNSLWQVPLAAAVAASICFALRNAPASYRHAIWVAALAVAIFLPLTGVRRDARGETRAYDPSMVMSDAARADSMRPTTHPQASARSATEASQTPRTVSFTQTTAAFLVAAYLLFVLFRLASLTLALIRTLALQRCAPGGLATGAVERVRERCQRAFGLTDICLIFTGRVAAPASAGRAILLPEALRDDASEDVLTTAIGHEMAHIARRDFACNLIYEIVSLPVSFHPATWFLRREIARTREMACDELVAGSLIAAAPYARSIVRIAAGAISTPPPAYLLGALDGGNLEQRIHSLTWPRASLKRPRLLLGAGFAALAICAGLASSVALSARAQDATSDLMKSAAAAYKRGDYQDAAAQLRTAVGQDPANIAAKIALANALLRQYTPTQIPEPVSAEARRQYSDALAIDPKNKPAIDGTMFLFIATKQFGEAHDFALQAIKNDAGDKSLYYTLGFLDWSLAYPDYAAARKAAGMQAADPGNIPDASLRETLREKHGAQIEEGFRMLQIALQLDPNYSDAMAYLNLLDRIAAGFADTPGQAADYIAKANDWVDKAVATKRKAAANPAPKAAQTDNMMDLTHGPSAPPPPPPPPPSQRGNGAPMVQGAISVPPRVQAAKVVSQPQPIYPSEARKAGVEGQVLLNVTVAKDGSVMGVEAAQGDTVLAQAAIRAVRQWKYQPTLVNGQPVEVKTQVTVIFSLGQ